jgi:hypothetical protein
MARMPPIPLRFDRRMDRSGWFMLATRCMRARLLRARRAVARQDADPIAGRPVQYDGIIIARMIG